MSVWENLADEVDAKVTALGSTGALHELVGAESLTSNLFGLMSIQSQLSIITGQNFMGIWENLADEIEAKVTALGSTGSLHELVGAESLTSNLFGLMSIKALLSMINSNSSSPSSGGKLLNFAFNRLTTQASQSLSANVQTPITGLQISYTPISATSKLLISVEFCGTVETDSLGSSGNVSFGLIKDSTPIGNIEGYKYFTFGSIYSENGGIDGFGNTILKSTYQYVDDSVNTSERIYKASAWSPNGSVLYVNRDSESFRSFTSQILVKEIAA